MPFLVNYLIFCVPTLHINDYRNGDIVLNTLITEFITLCVKHHMTGKVPKSKDFYKVSLCSNTIVSTCMVAVALKATGEMVGEIVVMPSERTFSLGYTFSYRHHRQGYAFEALSALMEMLHLRYPGWEFICFTDPENQPSMALLRKLGYREMGYLPARESKVFGKWTTAATEAEIARAAGQAE